MAPTSGNQYGHYGQYDQYDQYGKQYGSANTNYDQNNYNNPYNSHNTYRQNPYNTHQQQPQTNYGDPYGRSRAYDNNNYNTNVDMHSGSISNHYSGINLEEAADNSHEAHQPESPPVYGEETDTSQDYNNDPYSNVRDDEKKLNLGDFGTGIQPGEPGIPGGMTTITVLVLVSLLCILICIFGLITLLKKRNPDTETYSAAVQNRYFTSDNKEMSCLNCRLIEMGSMACYQELCPQCGRPPPNR